MYRCNNRPACKWSRSVLHGSFFADGKKPINEVLVLLDLWLKKRHPSTIMSIFPGSWTENTVGAYFWHFLQLVSVSLVLYLENTDNSDIVLV